jgi:glycosyltransferase involved in cell wall biosynthesis
VTGLLVDDVAQLADAVGELIDDTEARTVMGEKARARANEFSWEQTGNGVYQVLASVARGQHSSGLIPPGP